MELAEVVQNFKMPTNPWTLHDPEMLAVIVYNEIYLRKRVCPRFICVGKIDAFISSLVSAWNSLPSGQRIQIVNLNMSHWLAIEIKKCGNKLSLIIFNSVDYRIYSWFFDDIEAAKSIDIRYTFISTHLVSLPCAYIQTDRINCAAFSLDTLFRVEKISDLHEAIFCSSGRNQEACMTAECAQKTMMELDAVRLRNIQDWRFIKDPFPKSILGVGFGKSGQILSSYWKEHTENVAAKKNKLFNYGIEHKKESWRQKVLQSGFLNYLTRYPQIYKNMLNNMSGIDFLGRGISQSSVIFP